MENRYVYVKEVDRINHRVYFKITDFETLETVIFKDVNLGDYKSEDDFSNQCKLFDDTFAFSRMALNNLDKGELVVDNKKDDMEAVNTEMNRYVYKKEVDDEKYKTTILFSKKLRAER